MNSFVFPFPTIDWWSIMPIIVLALGGVAALLAEMFRGGRDNGPIIGISLAAIAGSAAVLAIQLQAPTLESFNQMVYRDRFAMVLQLLILLVTFLTVLFSEEYLREKRIPFGEFYPMLLWCAAGGMIMVGTKSLLMFFIGLEVLSIALYVLAGLSKQEPKSEESAIKYFLLGAFGSAFLLYGMALVFGATGGLHMDNIAMGAASDSPMVRTLLTFGLGFLLIGLCFKAALVPFHQWSPDVYQGAPTNVTAFMASASKVAAVGGLFRILEASAAMREVWMPFLYVVAILTMVFGTVVALVQTDLKRMFAYAGIATSGYMLVGMMAYALNPVSINSSAVLFFLIGYAVTTLGTFAMITLVARSGREQTRFEDLHGLWKREPWAAVTLVLLGISIIGIPPSAGFIGKFQIFQDALQVGLAPLAIIMALTSIVSIAYYLNVIRAAFIEKPDEHTVQLAPMSPTLKLVAFTCAASTILLIGLSGPLRDYMGRETVPSTLSTQSTTVDSVHAKR